LPRDSNAIYSLPAGYLAVTGETVLASQHNAPLEDIAQALTGSLPRAGTGAMQADLPMGGFKIEGMADGSASDDGATVGQVTAAIAATIYPGSIIEWGGTTAPTGWLLCYGQAISRTTYAALFAAISTAHGAGDGSTTFNVPDCRGRVSAGKDDMGGTSANRLTNQTGGLNGDTLGATGGAETHTLLTAQLPTTTVVGTIGASGAHDHGASGGGWAFGNNAGSSSPSGVDFSAGELGCSPKQVFSAAVDHTHTFTATPFGSDGAHNNVQPTIILNKIIKT
jgi:microcystin-dependent protein